MAKNYLMRLVAFLMLLMMVSSMELQRTQIHQLFTPEERKQIFGTDDENETLVLDYDLNHINWSKHHKRSIDGITPLPVFNKDIDLNLKRFSPLVGPNMPAYYFRTSSEGLDHTIEYPFADDSSRSLTQRKSRSIDNNYNIAEETNFNTGGKLSGLIFEQFIRNTIHRSVPRPNVIYPEILLLVDYSLKRIFETNDHLLNYVLTFWSRVDGLYKSLRDPEYKLSIAGVVLAEDITAFNFINDNLNNVGTDNEKLDFKKALRGVEKWLYNYRHIIPIDSYDVAMVQTLKISTNTMVKITDNEKISTYERGLSEIKGACRVDYENSVIKKAGIITDDGKYHGVLFAAHELGHTLGADHDEAKFEGDDAGFIMSRAPQSSTSNQYKWSQRSVQDLKSFLEKNPQCLYNVPKQYEDLEPNSSSDGVNKAGLKSALR